MSTLIGTPLEDTLTGDPNSPNTIFGDAADSLPPHATGGDDRLTGAASGSNNIYGDTGGELISGHGGHDILTGGANSLNLLVGDATVLSASVGGADILRGGNNSFNTIIGDAVFFTNGSTGNNDILIAGDNTFYLLVNLLFGDSSETMSVGASGGVDRLVSGTGVDHMWGDFRQRESGTFGQRDIFVFGPNNNDDVIHDFDQGRDIIDVTAVVRDFVGADARSAGKVSHSARGFNFADLDIEETDVDGDAIGDSVIRFDERNSVTVLGVTGLSAADVLPNNDGGSYVLFGRTSAANFGRDNWTGSEGNSKSANPGNNAARSRFDADTATDEGCVLAGTALTVESALADYVTDGVLLTPDVAMFNITESIPGSFATEGELFGIIEGGELLFAASNTGFDRARSISDLPGTRLHLAQFDHDWNGIKNLEISLDSSSSFHDIRLENFVDTRVKIGDRPPNPNQPVGESFDVQVLGAKRGEVDASQASQAMNLLLAPWTNDGTLQNSFALQGSVFADVVTVVPGEVIDSRFGQGDAWYMRPPFDGGPPAIYMGVFTTVFADLGDGADTFHSDFGFGLPHDGGPLIQTRDIVRGGGGDDDIGTGEGNDTVWGGSGDDVLTTFHGNDKLFGDDGGAASAGGSIAGANTSGNDQLFAGEGADWIEGNGDDGVVVSESTGGTLDLSFAGDRIDCGEHSRARRPDSERDIVNFNAGDGFDVVFNFGAGLVQTGTGLSLENVHDVLRVEISNPSLLSVRVVNSTQGPGTLVEIEGAGVFLVGVTTPLAQSVDGNFLRLFDAS